MFYSLSKKLCWSISDYAVHLHDNSICRSHHVPGAQNNIVVDAVIVNVGTITKSFFANNILMDKCIHVFWRLWIKQHVKSFKITLFVASLEYNSLPQRCCCCWKPCLKGSIVLRQPHIAFHWLVLCVVAYVVKAGVSDRTSWDNFIHYQITT